MANPIINISELTTSYGETDILKNVSLKIYPGDIVVILGTSGCGKTTLLKHMIGLLKSSRGEIKLFNKELVSLNDNEYVDIMRRVGVLFQNSALLNSITVAENVAIPLEQHTKMPPYIIEKIVRLKLSLVGLEYAYNYLPTELSGGMKKRVALARAISLDPVLLFADEPSAGLDPVTAKSLDNLLLSLSRQLGMTLIVVTHEISSIKRIAQKVCFLDEGRILFFGMLKDALKSDLPEIKSFFETHN